jgi:hypothetical protein
MGGPHGLSTIDFVLGLTCREGHSSIGRRGQNHALQKRLIAFTVTTEESHHAWAYNTRNVVALLKQKAPASVDD